MRPLALTLALLVAFSAAAQDAAPAAPTVDRLLLRRGWAQTPEGHWYELPGGQWTAEETAKADAREREQLRSENASLRESALKAGALPVVETGAALVVGVLLGLFIRGQVQQK